MKKFLFASMMLVSATTFANSSSLANGEFGSFTVKEIPAEKMIEGGVDGTLPTKPGNTGTVGTTGTTTGGLPGGIIVPEIPTYPDYGYPRPQRPDRAEQFGKVIGTTKELVALGEAIYELVKKGKPSNVTEYAPISVIPRNPTTKEYIDPFDLECFTDPVEKNFLAEVTNARGKVVVSFKYKVVYSHSGTYNGVGRYLTNVIIIPSEIKTSFGWDFNATMKLTGTMNKGTKAEPIAGVMITVKYQMNSWIKSFERNDTVYITGNGDLKVLNAK